MPRVKVMIPDPLLQVAADAAHGAGRKIDDLYAAAIVESSRPTSTRGRERCETAAGCPAYDGARWRELL